MAHGASGAGRRRIRRASLIVVLHHLVVVLLHHLVVVLLHHLAIIHGMLGHCAGLMAAAVWQLHGKRRRHCAAGRKRQPQQHEQGDQFADGV